MKYIAIKSHGLTPAEKIELPRATVVYNSISAMTEDLKKKCPDEELTQHHCYQCEDSQTTFICGKYFTKDYTTFTIILHADCISLNKPVDTEQTEQTTAQLSKRRKSNTQQTKMKFHSFAELSLPIEKE